MAIFQQAVVSGVSALAGVGEQEAYDQAYNITYAAEAKRQNIRNAMHTATLNLSAIRRDKVLTNTQIQMQQDDAEARAKVAAATAGVEGGSVEDILYETKKNEAMAINNANARAEQSIESQLAQINSGMSSLLAVNDDLPNIDYVDDMLGALSSLSLDDVEVAEAYWSDSEGGE